MVLKEFPPGPATRGTIRVYRVVHFLTTQLAQPAVKVYPATPEQGLQLFVHEPEIAEYPDGRRLRWNAALTGAHDVTVRRIVPARFLMIQAVFEPGALYRLTGIPGTELQNAYVDADGVFGSRLRHLRESLPELHSYEAMAARVDDFFASCDVRRKHRHPAEPLLRWLRDQPGASVDLLAAQASLSVRQFERVCREHTGLAPRELASMMRFDRAFHAKLQQPAMDWLSVAIACGYYDYQHMSREFRAISGLTPPRLLETQQSSPEHQLGIRHEFGLSYSLT